MPLPRRKQAPPRPTDDDVARVALLAFAFGAGVGAGVGVVSTIGNAIRAVRFGGGGGERARVPLA